MDPSHRWGPRAGGPARWAVPGLALLMLAAACGPRAKLDEAALAPRSESTKIFAADGSVITTLKAEENRELIGIEDIPLQVRNAVVAIEDSRFYQHRGFDVKAILRAMYANAKSGHVLEGGSTITQQLVRNALKSVGREKTLSRKAREASYAYGVESRYTKDKILELYLNTVYFGEGAYGAQAAAQTYFGKQVKDLNLSESALLAGLIRAPVLYDPYTNAKAALERRNLVLDRMLKLGLAAEDDVAAARSTELGVQKKADSYRYPAPYFVDYITREIQYSKEFSDLGDSVAERAGRLFRGGLRIYTTLDPGVQAAAEDAVSKVLDHPDADPSASLVAIDPKDGHIKALIGGRDFFAGKDSDPCVKLGALNDDGSPKTCAKVNLALGHAGGGSGRQSGSAFKPFVLATALAQGRHLTDTYSAPSCIDIPKADAGHAWHVCNYEDASFGGAMTVREGTVKSVNTVYAQLIMDTGAEEVVKTASRLGVGQPENDMGLGVPLVPVPSAALGANAVSPLDMASAFTTFSNLGVHIRPVSITKITDNRGTVLWKSVERKEQVLNPGVSFLTNQVLQDVIDRGTAAHNGRIGRPAFGKTGTAEEWRDAWFVGGAGTDLVAAVAVFWPDGEIEMKPSCDGSSAYQVAGGHAASPRCRATRIRVSGGSWPTQIWQIFMLKALAGTPASTFPVPKVEIVSVEVDVSRGCLPNPYTPPELIRTQTFIKGTEPATICKEPTGPSLVTLPSMSGFPEKQAVKLLQQSGFSVAEKTEASLELPPGYVVRQDPEPADNVPIGTKVTLWISTSAAAKTVPDVVNMTGANARQTLEAAGFAVSVETTAPCRNRADCYVWAEDPPAGTSSFEGATVTISLKLKPD